MEVEHYHTLDSKLNKKHGGEPMADLIKPFWRGTEPSLGGYQQRLISGACILCKAAQLERCALSRSHVQVSFLAGVDAPLPERQRGKLRTTRDGVEDLVT